MMKMKKFFDDFNNVMVISTLLSLAILCSFALGSYWGYYWNDGHDRTYRELRVLQEQIVELSQDNKCNVKKK